MLQVLNKFKACCSRRFSTTPKTLANVAIYEPDTKVGQNLALLLKQCPTISELRLLGSKPMDGLLMDLSHINTRTQVSQHLTPNEWFKAVYNTDVYVVVAPNLSLKGDADDLKLTEVLRDYIHNSLSPITEIEKAPLVVFCVEPIPWAVRIAKKFLEIHEVYHPSKFLVPFTHVSSMINTRVAQKLKIPPEYLNCFTSIGTKVEHLWPLIEPNHPTLSEKECKRKSLFTQKIQDEIVIEYTKLIKGSQKPIYLYAYALTHFLNTICYSIDNEIVTSLNTVIEVFVDDCKLDEGYFASAQVLINKNGVIDQSRAYDAQDKPFQDGSEKVRQGHEDSEKNLNKTSPDELIFDSV